MKPPQNITQHDSWARRIVPHTTPDCRGTAHHTHPTHRAQSTHRVQPTHRTPTHATPRLRPVVCGLRQPQALCLQAFLNLLIFCAFSLSSSTQAAPTSRPTTRRSQKHVSNTHRGPHKHRATTRRTLTQEANKRQQKQRFYQRYLALRRRILNPRGGLIEQLKLLQPKRLQRLLHLQSELEPLFLQGIRRSPNYDAVQFVSKKTAEQGSYVVGIQVWRMPIQRLKRTWETQRQQYPQAQVMQRISLQRSGHRRKLQHTPLLGRAAFMAYRAPWSYLNFITSRRNLLISLSCHQAHCTQTQTLLTLARWIDQTIR